MKSSSNAYRHGEGVQEKLWVVAAVGGDERWENVVVDRLRRTRMVDDGWVIREAHVRGLSEGSFLAGKKAREGELDDGAVRSLRGRTSSYGDGREVSWMSYHLSKDVMACRARCFSELKDNGS
jgi:hypothetical protein